MEADKVIKMEIIMQNKHHKNMLIYQIKHHIINLLNLFHKQKKKYKHNLQLRKKIIIKNIKMYQIKNQIIENLLFWINQCLSIILNF
jgi:hypothetical protein